MKRSEAFPSKYLSKEDVETPKTWTIDIVVHEEFEDDDGKKQKPILRFVESDSKPCVLNNTRWTILETEISPESDDWHGKKVELFKDPNVMFGKKRVGGIGIRVAGNGNGHGAALPAIDRPALLAQFKQIREKIRELGGNVPELKGEDIAGDKLMQQITAHLEIQEALEVAKL